jgi:hypothetical protein
MNPAKEIHILVIFSCHTGEVEQLALAAAVGAVQVRASIRLRRIVDPAISPNPSTERMDQDYVAPRPADTAWADGFVLAIPSRFSSQIEALGGLAGKPAVSLGETLQNLDGLSDREGGAVDREGARSLGQRVAETARARKESPQ